MTPFSLVQVYRLFKRSCCLHHPIGFIVDKSFASRKLVQLVCSAPHLSKQKPCTQLLIIVSCKFRHTNCLLCPRKRGISWHNFYCCIYLFKLAPSRIIHKPLRTANYKETLIMMNKTLHRNSNHCCCYFLYHRHFLNRHEVLNSRRHIHNIPTMFLRPTYEKEIIILATTATRSGRSNSIHTRYVIENEFP